MANQNNESTFMSWISEKVSPAQLSELYLALCEIEQQARKVKLIKGSLYEYLDATTVKRIRINIEQSKIFKLTHKKQLGHIFSALNFLLQFANQTAVSADTNKEATRDSTIGSKMDLRVSSTRQKLSDEVRQEKEIQRTVCDDTSELLVEPATTQRERLKPDLPVRQYYREDKETFYRWLKEDQLMAENTCRNYVSAIRGAEKFAEEHGFAMKKLYASDIDEVMATVDALFGDAEFLQYNQEQHKRFSSAISKYIVFLRRNQGTEVTLDAQESCDKAIIERAESFVLEADLGGVTAEELAVKLNTSVHSTKKAIQESTAIVSICDRMIHKEAFMDWEDGAAQLDTILEKLMVKNNGYASGTQLYEYARVGMQLFLNDNDMADQRKVFDMAEHLFEKEGYHGKQYAFSMKMHISRTDEIVASKLDVIRKFARDEGGCFREVDLESYLQSLGIKTANLRQQMRVYEESTFLFYEPGVFITSESMHIDEVWLSQVKKALSKLFADVGDHVILRDIQPWWYTLLPVLPGGKFWTPLLLQSVLMHYSKAVDARTICALTSQTGDTLNAMVIHLDSEVQTFGDVVIALLLEDHIDQRRFDAEELRQLLVRRGVIAGNELLWNMPKALPGDERYNWDADGQHVTINI